MKIKNLTILQKMLLTPFVGMLLYAGYIAYIYNEQAQSHQNMTFLQESYFPVLELTSENVILFDNITKTLKDAVLAGEYEWIMQSESDKQQIIDNLAQLEQYASFDHVEDLQQIQLDFLLYYQSAITLSRAMIKQNMQTEDLGVLIENMERYQNTASLHFTTEKITHQKNFSNQLTTITMRLNEVLVVGINVGIISLFILISVAFLMSISTQRSLKQVIEPLKDIAQGKPCFAKRLQRTSQDELGELVKWFNLLSEKLEQDYKAIELLSITDKLTQLYNRTKVDEIFDIEVNKAERYQTPLSVIMLDIDYFKKVNDEHGHPTGDRVLQGVANILRENIRKTDYIGRIGGEEFIVIAPHSDLHQTALLAELLRKKIAIHTFDDVGAKTISLGVASYRQGDTSSTLIKRVDERLYQAKEAGRNQVVKEVFLDIN